MKKTNFYLILLFSVLVLGCKKDDDDDLSGNWTRSTDFEGVPRNGAIGFTISDFAYVGTGYDGDDRLKDMWKFDPDKKTWFKLADFPGKARSNAVAFSINDKGYVGCGYDGDDALKDFWEYNPATDTWRQIADFPTTQGRYDAVAFAVGSKGYVGTGKDNDDKDQQDFYSYDAGSNQWQKINSIGIKRSGAFALVINGVAYVGGGTNNGSYASEFYMFDQQSGAWVEKKDLNRADDDDNDDDSDDDDYNISRENTMAFAIADKGYITCGQSSGAKNDTWRYDVNKDLWTEVDAFEGANREYGVAFSLKGLGYVTTGNNGSNRLDDTWLFDPNSSDDD
ncbi:Kelch repeat-containing protein [Mucilaginibacter phyllosphaerae]|uniref:Galactose oxidase n=1 Tax=Mucilaginibacter phyllosphaerae TaxID=1812349 RepID=A0A4Y8AHI2_9SPHI|nr:kelch repeat-containing protein [Mucilaginibacter phyllosphaerae]MBB3968729.1 N-acetylneuraminic acid mutarotase [Mucilaginibacter phyllosphaerae]TEW67635.1 galactose oxidase [Mucilaginibacter phyllosphaerae]GGH14248.1 hypothetical protein GCM10007352_22210 [Mucilaginibacter phyllosphaerae]